MDPLALGLPHREPFVFVDEVLEVVRGERAMGVKTFGAQEKIFSGHFPGNPIVPGVLLTEALAQMAGLAAGLQDRSFLLSAIRNMKFPWAVKPDQKVTLEARHSGTMGPLWMFNVVARVDDLVVAEGQIVLNEIS